MAKTFQLGTVGARCLTAIGMLQTHLGVLNRAGACLRRCHLESLGRIWCSFSTPLCVEPDSLLKNILEEISKSDISSLLISILEGKKILKEKLTEQISTCVWSIVNLVAMSHSFVEVSVCPKLTTANWEDTLRIVDSCPVGSGSSPISRRIWNYSSVGPLFSLGLSASFLFFSCLSTLNTGFTVPIPYHTTTAHFLDPRWALLPSRLSQPHHILQSYSGYSQHFLGSAFSHHIITKQF